ncbi:zinc-binding dehydrogenase [Hypoxylon rubiginosum]|uniref:Zinc-binding dehydrogenase n=1 Tax=Hypoxylon rubiginosum TaxID=110542 RepID=A0ACB9YVC1_9PEZI|nr:zinc-binding dehydrogenase [Hypoxylon rubiginosum]
MASSTPKTASQWNVIGFDGFDSLKYSEKPVPDFGDDQVLVRLHGASLNYRDLMIPRGQYPWESKPGVVPGSDGAGIVLAVGKHVTRFQPGDKVVTMLNPKHIAGSVTGRISSFGLGASVDGTFRSVGAFDEHGLVAMPRDLTFTEAATLSCAGVTAWNALFGLPGKQVSAGQWVLTQGTGGVSIFAVQFAKAVGARVIATTSSSEKGKLLGKLGADHIINYRETPEWGPEARKLIGDGVDVVVEVAGPVSMKQSVASVKLDGLIVVVGSVAGGEAKEMPSLLDCWMNLFTTRGVWVGNRLQMEDMCRAIEGNLEKLRPVLDPKVFSLDQLKEAYEYLESGKHQGKVGIEIH